MQKYISVNELYSKLCGRLSTLQLEKIKSIIAECDTITVNESEDEWWTKGIYAEVKEKITAN